MANGKYINTDTVLKVGSTDLSKWAFNVDTPFTKNQVDVSGFNAAGAQEFLPGAKDERVTASFRQSFVSGGPDQTLWPLYDSGTSFVLTVQPNSTGGTSAMNPIYSGTANIFEYHPVNSGFGDVANIDVTFIYTGGVTRGTA